MVTGNIAKLNTAATLAHPRLELFLSRVCVNELRRNRFNEERSRVTPRRHAYLASLPSDGKPSDWETSESMCVEKENAAYAFAVPGSFYHRI